MEFRRLRAGIRRIRGKAAFSLVETMVSFALLGIAALITASGLTVALGIYQSANELRKTSDSASAMLYEAAQSDDEFDILNKSDPQLGEVTHTGDFSPERSESGTIDVYTVCAVRNDFFKKNIGVIFYYFGTDNG